MIVTRPSVLLDYPFPDFFLQYWSENQPQPERYEEHLRKAGFDVASTSAESFPLRIKRDVWYRMLHQRFWSWLTLFSDEEIQSGIEELERKFPVNAEASSSDFCF